MTQKHVTALPLAEEQALIREAQDGHEGALMLLIDAYRPAILRAARKFAVEDAHAEDAEQEATLAFIEAVKSHDFARADRMADYVVAALRNHMTEAMTDNASAWGIPARTARLYFHILRQTDGDVLAAAALAPRHEMSRATFVELSSLLHTGSLSEPDRDAAPAVESARPVSGAPSDAYADLDRSLTAHALLGEIADDAAATAIVRFAYGFDDAYVDGALIDPVVPDGTISQIMPFPTEKGTAWTRPTVQRRRVAALALMREKHELTNTKEND